MREKVVEKIFQKSFRNLLTLFPLLLKSCPLLIATPAEKSDRTQLTVGAV
jgi:hypothetical protein